MKRGGWNVFSWRSRRNNRAFRGNSKILRERMIIAADSRKRFKIWTIYWWGYWADKNDTVYAYGKYAHSIYQTVCFIADATGGNCCDRFLYSPAWRNPRFGTIQGRTKYLRPVLFRNHTSAAASRGQSALGRGNGQGRWWLRKTKGRYLKRYLMEL